ncbi:MAG TPA: hemolysin family protein [Gemmataceae bacterium]
MLLADVEPPIEWHWALLRLLAIPALVGLNAFFVAAEFALVAVRRTRVEEMVKQGVAGASGVQLATQNLDRSIAATQLGITIASIALGWVAEPALAGLITPLFAFLPPDWQWMTAHSLAVLVAFFLITVMHVIFGELMPKAVALQSPDTTALLVARPLNVFARLSRPLIIVMNGTGNWLLRRLGYNRGGTEAAIHSVEELRLLVEDTEEAGLLDPEQADLVQNVFLLTNKKVRDCMIPREKVAALDINATPEQVLEAVREGAHTRMPVYDGELDNVVGIVNTKNLFFLFSLRGVVVLEDALYPATYLDPDESIANALRLFRKSRRPMALVRDESDRILGIVTLEDVLEEIVGDIEDEHDYPVPRLVFRRPSPPAKPKRSAP